MARRWLLLTFLIIPSAAAAAIVHPLLRAAIDREQPILSEAVARTSTSPLTEGAEAIGVWVRTRDGGRALEAAGLLGRGKSGDPRPALWTPDQIRRAAQDPSVISLMPGVRCDLYLDSSLVECGGRAVHDLHGTPPNYAGLTGRNIVIGMVDSGIDLQHQDFRDDLGHTRLVSLWDQTLPSSDPPRNFNFGKEWTAAQIDAGLSPENDPAGHGTHVMGIAAGSGRATGNGQPPYRYVGMAPDASIIVVKTDYLTTSVADAVDYIFQKADSLGLPAVVNLSLGTQYGAHDGTDDFARSLAALAGPGHALVSAAGNETGKGYHARRILSPPDTSSTTFRVPTYTPNAGPGNDEVDIDGWYTGTTAITFTVVSPNGYDVGPVARGASMQADTPDGRIEIDNSMTGAINGERNVFFWIHDQLAGSPPASGTWKILMQAEPVNAASAASTFDAWIFYRTMTGDLPFLRGADERFLVSSPASGDSVIAVGAYTTKVSWFAEDGRQYGYSPAPTLGAIASFSSVGPRRDDVIKPDVSAPGQGIGAALSSATSQNPHAILLDGVHVVFQGTSMSSPHVAGLTALMFEHRGRLSMRAVAERLRGTARHDAFTGPNANPVYGYGKIDAVGATGYLVPVLLLEAEAVESNGRVRVRFLLTEDAGATPFEIYRDGPDDPVRRSVGWSSGGPERTFVDSTLTEDGDYRYWLRVPDVGGPVWAGPATVHFIGRAEPFRLEIGPNPFVDRVRLRWNLSAEAASVTIHDLVGRRVRSLPIVVDGSGRVAAWDGRDEEDRMAPAGIYIARLRLADGRTVERKLLRLR